MRPPPIRRALLILLVPAAAAVGGWVGRDPLRIRFAPRMLAPLPEGGENLPLGLEDGPLPGIPTAGEPIVLLSQEPLREGETLASPATAAVSFNLASGYRLLLAPGGRARLGAFRPSRPGSRGSLALTLSRGTLRVALAPVSAPIELRVRTPDLRVLLDEVRPEVLPVGDVARTDRGTLFALRSGLALAGSRGAWVALAAGAWTGSPTRPGGIEVRPLPPFPDPLAPAGGGAVPGLAWPPVPGAEAYAVQIARDPPFRTLLRDLRLPGPPATVEGLPSGSYLARAATFGEEGLAGLFSPPFPLHVPEGGPLASLPPASPGQGRSPRARRPGERLEEVGAPPEPPRLIAPPSGQTISAQGPAAVVSFEWVSDWAPDPEGIAGYRIQIASDAEFKTLVRDQRVIGLPCRVRGLSPGRHWWRVLTFNRSGGMSEWSDPSTFEIAR